MQTNRTREKLIAGQAAFGTFMGLGSPNLAELLSQVGLDYLVIETEHNGLDSAEIEHMLMAIKGTETTPIVRIPSHDTVYIQRALDMGAMGIIVPLLKTATEAEAIVAASRYPPDGTRGWGPLRASQYTLDNDDYIKRANDNILVAGLLETKEAVENLDEITSVPGLDALFIGMWDLCFSMGLNPMDMPFPETDAVIERALEIGKKNGVAIGMGSNTPEDLIRHKTQGFTFLAYGPDYYLMINAINAGLEAFNQ
jgi:2-keto-3-deoxy-L-rhamnonate aldolase RhmA